MALITRSLVVAAAATIISGCASETPTSDEGQKLNLSTAAFQECKEAVAEEMMARHPSAAYVNFQDGVIRQTAPNKYEVSGLVVSRDMIDEERGKVSPEVNSAEFKCVAEGRPGWNGRVGGKPRLIA